MIIFLINWPLLYSHYDEVVNTYCCEPFSYSTNLPAHTMYYFTNINNLCCRVDSSHAFLWPLMNVIAMFAFVRSVGNKVYYYYILCCSMFTDNDVPISKGSGVLVSICSCTYLISLKFGLHTIKSWISWHLFQWCGSWNRQKMAKFCLVCPKKY